MSDGAQESAEPCPLCGKPPGQKVGPPALAKCVNPTCEGSKLGAKTLLDWNTRATPPAAPAGGENAARVPKVRTSHGRNAEEAARLQKLVDEKFAPAQSAPGHDIEAAIERMESADHRDAMREAGEQADPVLESLRRMIAEFGDEHYHTCPANEDGPCECFAGALNAQVRTVFDNAVASHAQPNDIEAAIDRIISIRNGMTTDLEARAIVRRELAAFGATAQSNGDEGELIKLLDEARYFLNFRQEGPDCDHADLIDEASDEIKSLRDQLAKARAALETAKRQLITLGGDREWLNIGDADQIHAAVLDEIDTVLEGSRS